MLISLNWLKTYVACSEDAGKIAEVLTSLGLEIEEINEQAGNISGVVSAQVLECEPHPNADKLSLCKVSDGTDTCSVVCGAPNVRAGQKVLLAKVGALLTGGFKLKKSKIRGCPSEGMICAEDELGLGTSHEGILVLPEKSPLGIPLREIPGLCDVQFDVNVTPNRPDALCHIGVAREIAAHYHLPLSLPHTDIARSNADETCLAKVEVAPSAQADCSRYLGRVIRDVQVGPSPEWLVSALESIGQKSINNVVDATNYVLHEYGQPSHAFDLDKLRGNSVIIRRGKSGESLETLDEVQRNVSPQDLVIADREGPICLAGVIGGESTKVDGETKNIFLEVAYFNPGTVRKQAKRHGISTDSSYRFERGVDPLATEQVSAYLAYLLAQLTGGNVDPGVTDVTAKEHPQTKSNVRLRTRRLEKVLGIGIPMETMVNLLESIEILKCGADETGTEWADFSIPGFRPDLEREIDLIEEVARLYDFNNIPSTLPVFELQKMPFPPIESLSGNLRHHLSSLGLHECISLRFTAAKYLECLSPNKQYPLQDLVQVKNPLTEEGTLLPPTLLVNLLRSVNLNQRNQEKQCRFFEIGKTFKSQEHLRTDRHPGVKENTRLAIVLAGAWEDCSWSSHNQGVDFHILKSIVESLPRVSQRPLEFRYEDVPELLHPKEAAWIYSEGTKLGFLGTLHPQVAAHFELKGPCVLAELSLTQWLEVPIHHPRFRQFGNVSSVSREMNIIVDQSISHETLLGWMPVKKTPYLEEVHLNSIYQGKEVEEGKKAMHYSFVYRHPEKSLTDEKVNKIQQKLAAQLQANPGVSFK